MVDLFLIRFPIDIKRRIFQEIKTSIFLAVQGTTLFGLGSIMSYLGPMLYRTIFGSVVAFGCYILLIGRIGADYAAYVMLLMPVVALILSTFFEDYLWSPNAVFGIIIVLIGNLIILTPAATLEKSLLKLKTS